MIKTNKLALGTVQWGLNYGISNLKGKTTSNEVKNILEKAQKENIKILDTSPQYGDSEKILGENNLENFDLVTKTEKFSNELISKKDKEFLISTFKKSLFKFSVNSIYGLLIHNVDDIFKEGGNYLIDGLETLKNKKFVEKIGISVYSSEQIDKALNIFKPDIIQAPINIFDQRLIKDGTLKKLKNLNIEVHARSIFLQGLIFLKDNNLPNYFQPWKKHIADWHKECFLNKISPLEAALSFGLEIPEINKLIIGVNNTSQLEEIIEVSRKPKSIKKDFSINDQRLVNPTNWQ